MLKQMLHTELPLWPSVFPIQTNFVHSSDYTTYPQYSWTNQWHYGDCFDKSHCFNLKGLLTISVIFYKLLWYFTQLFITQSEAMLLTIFLKSTIRHTKTI